MRRKRQIEPLPDECLNCGEPMRGRFCAACGQENEPPAPAFGPLLGELWQEFLQLDGKVLKTLWLLIAKPGFLSVEYVAGRRIRYLSPFRLYFWTTAITVLLFYKLNLLDSERLQRIADKAQAAVATPALTSKPSPTPKGDRSPKDKLASPSPPPKSNVNIHLDSKEQDFVNVASELAPIFTRDRPINLFGENVVFGQLPPTVLAYREAQKRLPEEKRDSSYRQLVIERAIRFKSNPWDALKSLVAGAIPNILIFCVPIWATVIKLFFPRRRYIEHLIFALHTHVFGVALVTGVVTVQRLTGFDRGLEIVTLLGLGVYNFLAARRFYSQSPWLLLLKGWGLSCSYGCILSLAIAIGFVVTLFWTFLNL